MSINLLPLCSNFRNNVYDTFPLPVIDILKTAAKPHHTEHIETLILCDSPTAHFPCWS